MYLMARWGDGKSAGLAPRYLTDIQPIDQHVMRPELVRVAPGRSARNL
jgi:hypothetical protein